MVATALRQFTQAVCAGYLLEPLTKYYRSVRGGLGILLGSVALVNILWVSNFSASVFTWRFMLQQGDSIPDLLAEFALNSFGVVR